MDKGLGDVKHHELSNVHILKLENVMYLQNIIQSLLQDRILQDIYALCVIQVKK